MLGCTQTTVTVLTVFQYLINKFLVNLGCLRVDKDEYQTRASAVKQPIQSQHKGQLTSSRSGPTTSLARMAGEGLLDETSPC